MVSDARLGTPQAPTFGLDTFGDRELGPDGEAETVEIHWPSGIVQTLHHVAAGQILHATEAAK